MFSPRSHGAEFGAKYDPAASQWMRESMESRQIIEELKAQNDKLQREIYGLNSKLNLIYECCGDMGVVDRLGDMMQRKLRNFQAAQAARNAPPTSPVAAARPLVSPPRSVRKSDFGTSDDGFICGSSAFQDVAAYPSSYKAQVSRSNFHRTRVLEAEEAKLRDQMDIFGVPKPGKYSPSARAGDTIDSLLLSSEAPNSPLPSARRDK